MILTSVCLTVVIFWFISVHQQDTEGKTSRESSSSCHMLDDLARTIDEHLEGTVHSLSLQSLSRVFFLIPIPENTIKRTHRIVPVIVLTIKL